MAITHEFDKLIDQLEQHEYAVIDDFFPPSLYHALRLEALEAHQSNEMRRAGIGQADDYAIASDIRRDHIQWLSKTYLNPAVREYFEAIDVLREVINYNFFLSLRDYEAHFAAYPMGGFYRKHRDQFKSTDARQISCVYFLNDQWQAQDAGELVMYRNRNATKIAPVGNRFVCFRSHLLHEVLPTQTLRLSLTGWMKREVIPFTA